MKYFQNEKWTLEEHKQNLMDVVDSLLVMYEVLFLGCNNSTGNVGC